MFTGLDPSIIRAIQEKMLYDQMMASGRGAQPVMSQGVDPATRASAEEAAYLQMIEASQQGNGMGGKSSLGSK